MILRNFKKWRNGLGYSLVYLQIIDQSFLFSCCQKMPLDGSIIPAPKSFKVSVILKFTLNTLVPSFAKSKFSAKTVSLKPDSSVSC